MRLITKEMVQAIKYRENFRKGNTTVEIFNGTAFVYLFGNNIAQVSEKDIFISTCGWETNTTRERLNGILSAYGLDKINQKNFVWYINGVELNGSKTFKL